MARKKFKLTTGKQVLLSIICIVLILLIVVNVGKAFNKPEIVVYKLSGAIMPSGSSDSYITPKLMHSIVEEVNNSKNIKAVVLFIDSPGGTIWASQEVAHEIQKIEKPVIASLGEMAASGGYYIACHCDKIVCYPTTLTGSIGVIMQVVNMSELMSKIGIKFDTYARGDYKDIYSGLRDLDDNEKLVIDVTVSIMYNHFVNTVAKERGLNPRYVRQLATGQLYTGYEAVQLGLVDQFGTTDDAIKLAAEISGADVTKVRDERYKTGLFSSMYGKVSNLVDLIVSADRATKVEVLYR